MNKRVLQLALVGAVSLVAGAQAGANPLYVGGRIIPSVRIVPIFYGNTWTASNLNSTRNYLTDLANYVRGAKNPSGKQTLYAQYGITGAQVVNLNCAACTDTNPRQLDLTEITNIIHAVQQQNNSPYAADKVFLLLPGPGYSTAAGPCGFSGRDGGDGQYYGVVARDCSPFQETVGRQILDVASDPNQGDAWLGVANSCVGHTFNFGAGAIPLPFNNHTGACPPFSNNPNTPFDTKMGEIVHTVVAVRGDIFHGFRHPNATWTGFGDVESVIGFDPGNFLDVAAQGIFGVFLHVIGITNTGHLFHAIRTDAGWVGFTDVNSLTGAGSMVFDRVSLANLNGDLSVCAVANGRVFHAIRSQNGSWSGFGDVFGQTGAPPGLPAGDVACAGIGGDMHMVVTTNLGGIFHAIRFAAGTWSGIGDVEAQAGNMGDPEAVSVANFLGELNVVVRNAQLFHAIRHSSSWSQFARLPNSSLSFDLGVAGTQDFLHVVSVDFGGVISLQSHDTVSSWSSPFNVTSATGFQATGSSSISATNGLGY